MTETTQTKTASKKAEKLREYLVGHANISDGKTVLFFFKKDDKKNQPLGPPVKVSFKQMSVVKENYQYGHSVYAKNLTASFCEKIIKLSKDLKLNIFFSVPALAKNTRKHDDITGIGCAFLDDVPANSFSEDMLSKGMVLPNFSFPVSTIIQTSPGNCQVLWNFKGFLPIDERYKGPQPTFLPAQPKHRKDLFNRMLGLLKKRLEGDPAGSNLNQIYRLPYTFNYKYSPAPEVELIHSDFSPENRVNFGEFYSNLLAPEIEKHYRDEFTDIFAKVRKNNDWILMENLLGWGESASSENTGRSWTANERDLSAAKRLVEYYNIPKETIEKLLLQSPNRQKGQDKGKHYFDSLFEKINKQAVEKHPSPTTVRRRVTFDIIRVFGEAAALIFSNRLKVEVKLPSTEGKRVEVWRFGGGMTRQRAKVLMWALSEAKKRIEIPFEKFMDRVLEMKVSDYDNERAFRKSAYKTFDRLIRPLVALRFGIGKYYGLDLNSSAREEGISPFKSFERTKDGMVIIELSPEMDKALENPERLKRLSNKFLPLIEKAKESITPPLLLWLGETFFDKKNANSKVKIESKDLIKRLQGPNKVSDSYTKRFRSRVYKAIKEINAGDLLKLVGSSARKIDVTSNREASEFVFEVSDFEGQNVLKG